MAEQITPRAGLPTWSEDTDRHPGRIGTNAIHRTLDSLVAIWAGQGLLSARPPAGVAGRFYVATNQGDGGRMAVDTGTGWLELSTNGGGGAGRPVVIEGSATEGTSQRSARADHTHVLPLATRSNHGAMASQWAELMETATAGGTPWTLALRDGSGRLRAGANPSHPLDVATKQSSEAVGTPGIVDNAIVRRWGNGAVSGPDPSKPEFYATRRYVDGRTSRREWKTDVEPIVEGIDELCDLDLNWWRYTEDAPGGGDGAGPFVEDVAEVAPRFTTRDDAGVPERVRDRDALWWVARAVQQVEERRSYDAALIEKQGQQIRKLESTVRDLVRIVNDLGAPDDMDLGDLI